MLTKLLSTGLITIVLSTPFAHAAFTCFEENPALTKLGWVTDNNHRITISNDAYRHVEERKISIQFINGKKNDIQVEVFNLADECHREEGLNMFKSPVDNLSKVIDHIALNTLDETMKIRNIVFESGKKERRSLFGKKLVNDPKDSYQQIMYKTAEEKLCNQKKYLAQALNNNDFNTKNKYEIKSYQVGIKEIHCGQDFVFPENIYCDLTYVRQLDIAPRK